MLIAMLIQMRLMLSGIVMTIITVGIARPPGSLAFGRLGASNKQPGKELK